LLENEKIKQSVLEVLDKSGISKIKHR